MTLLGSVPTQTWLANIIAAAQPDRTFDEFLAERGTVVESLSAIADSERVAQVARILFNAKGNRRMREYVTAIMGKIGEYARAADSRDYPQDEIDTITMSKAILEFALSGLDAEDCDVEATIGVLAESVQFAESAWAEQRFRGL